MLILQLFGPGVVVYLLFRLAWRQTRAGNVRVRLINLDGRTLIDVEGRAETVAFTVRMALDKGFKVVQGLPETHRPS